MPLNTKPQGDSFQLQPVQCMGACSRFCVVALTAANKLTFVFSDLPPIQSASELLQFSHQYLTHPTGTVPYKERPELICENVIGSAATCTYSTSTVDILMRTSPSCYFQSFINLFF